MRILVEGVGGIGGVVAGELVRAGLDPILVTGNPDITTAIGRDGLRVAGSGRPIVARAPAFTRLEDLPAGERYDVAFLAMKCHGVVDAARRTAPLLAEGGYLVTLQNGIVVDEVAAAVGTERVVGGIVGWGGTMHGPGVVERTSRGETVLGEFDGTRSQRVEVVAGALTGLGKVVVTENIRGAMWAKLAVNCCVTSFGALTGQTLGQMLAEARARRAFLGVYSEVVDTARALGIKLEKVAVNPDTLYLPRNAPWWLRAYKDLLIRIAGIKYRKLRSSSLQSLERGRKTEIDHLNGYVVAKAATVGVPVPLNTALVDLIHGIEAGERTIERANLDVLLAEAGRER